MKRQITLLVLLMLFLTAGTAACYKVEEQKEPAEMPEISLVAKGEKAVLDEKSLVEQRCTKCHNTDRIYSHKHNKAEWERVVNNMVAKGAKLNEVERKAVVEYLSGR